MTLRIMRASLEFSGWGEYGHPSFFGPATVYFLLMAVAIVTLVLGGKVGFWRTNKMFVTLLALIVLGLTTGGIAAVFRGIGYQTIGQLGEFSSIPEGAVTVLELVTNLIFLVSFSVFAWFLADATWDTVLDGKQGLKRALGVGLVVLTGAVCIYVLVMAIISFVPTNSFIADYSPLVLPMALVLETAAIFVLLVLAYRFVAKSAATLTNATRLKRSSLFMALGALTLTLATAAFLVVSAVWMFGAVEDGHVDQWDLFGYAVYFIRCGVFALLAAAAITYLLVPIVANLRTKATASKEAATPLLAEELDSVDSRRDSGAVPAGYDF